MALIEIQGMALPPRLEKISFTGDAGQVVGVIGPNGAGKSTLLHSLAGLLPFTGHYDFEGQPLGSMLARERARRISLLPQSTESAWPLSVEDVVALGRLPWGDQDKTAIQAAMSATGVDTFRKQRVDRLSGGEQARVWLARVLAGQPRLLIADEPTASLDLYYQRAVMDCIRAYANAGHLVIMAVHDLALAAQYCDRLILLDKGIPQAIGTPAQVLTEPLLSRVFRVSVHVDLNTTPPVISTRFQNTTS